MKKLLLILILILSGCALSPKKETAKLESSLNYDESQSLLKTFIKECWIKDGKWGSDSIRAKTSFTDGNTLITLGRDNSDIPFMPFATIEIKRANNKILFSISEGKTIMWKNWNVEKSLNAWVTKTGDCGR